jgi:hypothetical protein
MPENEAPPTRKPRSNGLTQLANEQIDRRLAEAIKERTKLHSQVSRMIYAQERLSRVEQEINSLVQLQQRLKGNGTSATSPEMIIAQPHPPFAEISYAGHNAELPSGIGSIPSGPRQPKPTTANAGPALSKEGGFS